MGRVVYFRESNWPELNRSFHLLTHDMDLRDPVSRAGSTSV